MATPLHAALTRRERDIMDVLFRLGRATAEEVINELSGTRSSSTVRTQLRVLEQKGHVRHEERGRQFVYAPSLPRRTARKSALRVNGLWTSGSFFETLGVPAVIGRTFSDLDDQPSGGPDGPVAVISYSFWQRHFDGASDAVGRALTLDGVQFTIVGVTPPAFFGMEVGRTFDVAAPG